MENKKYIHNNSSNGSLVVFFFARSSHIDFKTNVVKKANTLSKWSEAKRSPIKELNITTCCHIHQFNSESRSIAEMLLTHPLTIEEVNNLLSESFVRIFGNIVEHFPAAAIVILKKRPFSDVNDIVQAVFNYLDSLKISVEKERLLQLYPDFLGKLTYLSQWPLEMEITGTDHLTIEEKRRLNELNIRYKEKFGFPFIIDLKEKHVFTIFSELVARLQNGHEKEIHTAFNEVKSIVKLRIHEIVR